MNSRQRRKLKRFSERMFKTLDLSGITGMSIKWKPDREQPGIGERILTGQLEITRELMEFGVVSVDCWCDGLGTKDEPSEDDGKKYCGCAVGEAAFLAACRERRALKTGGLEE